MSGDVESRLKEKGLSLPKAAAPAANYVPYVVAGNLVFISGQLPMGPDGIQFKGRVGDSLTVEDGQKAAQLCALNILAQVREACGGDLSRVTRCVKLGGFVNAVEGFEQHPAVINGASDLIAEVLGDAGPHARFAVGAGSLPFNVAVEIDAIFQIS